MAKTLVESFGGRRHGDSGLYLGGGPSGARRWIVRVVVNGWKNKKGALLRMGFGLGSADIVTINQERERVQDNR
ncbi:MAG: hypothetical protein ACKVLA_11825 [Rhodobacterales bacterium]